MTEAIAVYNEEIFNIINKNLLERRVRTHIKKAIREIVEKRTELQKRYPSQYGIRVYEELGNGILTFAQAIARKLEKILMANLNIVKYHIVEHRMINVRTFIRIEDHSSIGYEDYGLFGSTFRFDIMLLITAEHETIEGWDKIYETKYLVHIIIKGKGYRTRDEKNRLYAVLEDYNVEKIDIKPYTI